jgi:hypothetical protein
MGGPTAQAATHRALEPCPAADALENLEGYRTAGAFGTLHQRLGNTVAHVALQGDLRPLSFFERRWVFFVG